METKIMITLKTIEMNDFYESDEDEQPTNISTTEEIEETLHNVFKQFLEQLNDRNSNLFNVFNEMINEEDSLAYEDFTELLDYGNFEIKVEEVKNNDDAQKT